MLSQANQTLSAYRKSLIAAERAAATIEKYMSNLTSFAAWLGNRPLEKEYMLLWRSELEEQYCPASVNAIISSVNGFLRFLNRPDCVLKFLKVQKRVFRDKKRSLSRGEYEQLVATAYRLGKERLNLLMEAIGSTGVRVSEVNYITAEALQSQKVVIKLKGKIRTILLPRKLFRKLLKYCHRQGIVRGCVFLTKTGHPMSRRQIWGEMKSICAAAGVEASKVFPHNLRRMMAREHYKRHRDIAKLADILGHSSVETTRIYLQETGEEHQRQIDELGLVS